MKQNPNWRLTTEVARALGSPDIQYIIALIDGRPELVHEIQSSAGDLREYLAGQAAYLENLDAFIEAIPGHLPPDLASQRRLPFILDRPREIGQV